MATVLNRLSPKFVANIDRPGRYADGGDVYLEVRGNAKSFVFIFSRKRWGGKTPGNIGLGSAHVVGALGEARRLRDIYRDQIRNGIDPLAKLKADRDRARLGDPKNMTFKAVADDFLEHRGGRASKPYRPRTLRRAVQMVNTIFEPLHQLRPADITPGDIFKIIQPIIAANRPATANAVLARARSIFDWANAHDIMEGKANPALLRGGRLSVLLGTDTITEKNEPREALDWHKVPALMAKLEEFKPRNFYTTGEAARITGRSTSAIFCAIYDGRLKTLNRNMAAPYTEHQIDPDSLFKLFKPLAHLPPGLPPVKIYLLKYLILNGARFDEVRNMRWSEWRRDEGLWVVPWQRMKCRNSSGCKEIRIDHIVPLVRQSIEILTLLDRQRELDGNDSEFVFGHYHAFFARTGERMGTPPSDTTVRNFLRTLVDLEDVLSTLHGMRTAFRSWGEAQNCFMEKDLERAIARVKGHGGTWFRFRTPARCSAAALRQSMT